MLKYVALIGIFLSCVSHAYLSPLGVNATELQGFGISTATPSSGNVLTWNGSLWAPAPASGGSGTVTSVGLSLPSFITVTGSPVTTTGTLTGTLATQSANLVFAGPSSGSAAAPTFRSLVGADQPAQTISVKSSGYTITAADILANTVFYADTSGGAFNLTLPAPNSSGITGKVFWVFDSTGSFGTNQVTMVRNGSESIQGLAASKPLYANWGLYAFQSNGTNWYIVSAKNRASRTFNSSGSFVIPAGVTQLQVTGRAATGGGGGGGGGNGGSAASAAAGGGAGGAGGAAPSTTQNYPVTSGDTATITIGAAGAGGTAGTGGGPNAAGAVGVNGGSGTSGGNTTVAVTGVTWLWAGSRNGDGGRAGVAFGTAGVAGNYGNGNWGSDLVAAAPGGAANTAGGASGTSAIRQSPYGTGAVNAGGAAGGAGGGGGGGGAANPSGGDFDSGTVTAVTSPGGGAGGAAGANGANAPDISATVVKGGEGGVGGGGGGGSGNGGTGVGGNGSAGSAGSNGRVIFQWWE